MLSTSPILIRSQCWSIHSKGWYCRKQIGVLIAPSQSILCSKRGLFSLTSSAINLFVLSTLETIGISNVRVHLTAVVANSLNSTIAHHPDIYGGLWSRIALVQVTPISKIPSPSAWLHPAYRGSDADPRNALSSAFSTKAYPLDIESPKGAPLSSRGRLGRNFSQLGRCHCSHSFGLAFRAFKDFHQRR